MENAVNLSLSFPSVGDIVEFGRYPQAADGTEESIKWRVLTIENRKALLLSEYGLDCVPYHGQFSAVTWESCDLRKWSNDYFYNRAFNRIEKSRITETLIKNVDNEEYSTNGGEDTYDNVFCLSRDESKKFFPADIERGGYYVNDRRCRKLTAYAANNGAFEYSYNNYHYWAIPAHDGNCVYWLRSPGYCMNDALAVNFRGFVGNCGFSILSSNVAFVPALWVCPSAFQFNE